MGKKIQLKRGEKKDLPLLATAEIGFTTDTEETFVGTNNKNVRLLDEKDGTKINQVIESLSRSTYYQGLEISRHRDSASLTDYYVVRIPHKDENGEIIKLKRGFAKDIENSGFTETARSFSKRHNTTVTVNASIFNTSTFKVSNTQIVDGRVLSTGSTPSRHILGIKSDNTLVSYPPGTSPDKIISDGCTNALTAFIPLIVNGTDVDPKIISDYDPNDTLHPRQVICQFDNKDLMIFTCDGRLTNNPGMSCKDVVRILKPYGVKFAFMLDGGGSSQTVHKNTLLNRSVDNNGYVEREVPDFLYITKEEIKQERDMEIASLNIDIGELSKKVADVLLDVQNKSDLNQGFARLRGPKGYTAQGIESWEGENKNTKLFMHKDYLSYHNYISGSDIFKVDANGSLSTKKGMFGEFFTTSKTITNANLITEGGLYWAVPSTTNTPDSASSYGIIHFQIGVDSSLQVAFPFAPSLPSKRRRKNAGIWEGWSNL